MSDRKDAPEAAGDRAGAPVVRAMPGALYVVATPLGNARDLTLRALDILRSVDIVAAEDTRVTAPFLARHGVAARLLSLHAHNEARRADAVIGALAAGKSVALVSDAGTPAISDPGARLVRVVREAGFSIVPIPGPSAVTAALSAAGLAAERFVFLGFLPAQAKARRELLAAVAALPMALVVYEAPHRVRATVAELAAALGEDRTLVVARELTKMYETIARMALVEASAWLDGDPNRQRGEFVLIVDAAAQAQSSSASLDAETKRLLDLLLTELPPARAARLAARWSGVPKDVVYAAIHAAGMHVRD